MRIYYSIPYAYYPTLKISDFFQKIYDYFFFYPSKIPVFLQRSNIQKQGVDPLDMILTN